MEAETLVGPAYKGIPLSVATAIALYHDYEKEMNYCFDRKEVKDHGEGGLFVGKQLVDGEKVIIIEDVMLVGSWAEFLYFKNGILPAENADEFKTLDRKELGKIVFSDNIKKQKLVEYI